MIARGVVYCADSCQLQGVYATEYKEVNEKTPESSCLEKTITAVALASCFVGFGVSYDCASGNFPAPICLNASEKFIKLLPVNSVICFSLVIPYCSDGLGVIDRDKEWILSSGLIRDCKVLNKTFTNVQRENSSIEMV